LYGFHTVKAIFPDKAAGFAVGTVVGFGVAVGPLVVGVAVGLRLVGVAVGLLVVDVGLGVRVAAVDVVVARAVADGLGVLITMGVHVGVGCPAPGAGVVPGAGITRTCPGRISAALVILLAAASAWALTPKRVAISESVSPALTV
jgi:hypothetical protein